jgi:hypothetical protein
MGGSFSRTNKPLFSFEGGTSAGEVKRTIESLGLPPAYAKILADPKAIAQDPSGVLGRAVSVSNAMKQGQAKDAKFRDLQAGALMQEGVTMGQLATTPQDKLDSINMIRVARGRGPLEIPALRYGKGKEGALSFLGLGSAPLENRDEVDKFIREVLASQKLAASPDGASLGPQITEEEIRQLLKPAESES